jgi:hypothetical protein
MKNLLIFIFLLCISTLQAQPDYAGFDQLLRQHVSAEGKVDYKLLKKHKTQLDSVVRDFQAVTPSTEWAKDAQLAFWINAYNLFTLKLITDNYPVKSIMDLDAGKTWAVKRITIGGKKYALDQIENQIIRPQFKDARIHFALNCAAKSCPPLHNEAFTESNVQTLLDQRTRQFILSAENQLSPQSIKVSKIFEWYIKDFGDLTTFLNSYSTIVIEKNARVIYADYNWKLNN